MKIFILRSEHKILSVISFFFFWAVRFKSRNKSVKKKTKKNEEYREEYFNLTLVIN